MTEQTGQDGGVNIAAETDCIAEMASQIREYLVPNKDREKDESAPTRTRIDALSEKLRRTQDNLGEVMVEIHKLTGEGGK